MVNRLMLWDVIAAVEHQPRLEPFYKNEHHGENAREIDRRLMQTVFEWRKRVFWGNDHLDQDWALMYLREARASMN